jgi:hypothetical protein
MRPAFTSEPSLLDAVPALMAVEQRNDAKLSDSP